MILVGQYDSPYTRRVAVSMHTLGIAFERNTISAFADADDMRKINPLGRIPSLILDDGEVLIDSVAILDYLDEQAGPERALLPRGGLERLRAWQTVALATGVLDKGGAVVYERSLRPPEKVHEPYIARLRTQLESGLAALERATGDGWFGGERALQPDITVGCVMWYMRARVSDVFSDAAYPRLARFADACETLPAFQAARPVEDEQMPSAPL